MERLEMEGCGWKSVFVGGLVLCLTLGASWFLSGVGFAQEEEEILEIDFEDMEIGQIPEGCRIAETAGDGKVGKWQVMEMEGAPSGKKVFSLVDTKNSGHTFNLAIAEEIQVKDLEIEVKVKALSGEEDQGGGPMWRVQDRDNYYIARWNPLENNLRVYYVKEGRRKQLASADVETDPKAWHEIEITMVGDKIVAELDDKKLIEVTDDTFTEAGMVGVWTKADAATAFDDFEIEEPEGEHHEHGEKHVHDKDHEHGEDHEHEHHEEKK